jgi:hypothetical protein
MRREAHRIQFLIYKRRQFYLSQELDCQNDLRHSQSAQTTGAAALNASHLRDEALQEWFDATCVHSAEDACTMAPTVR